MRVKGKSALVAGAAAMATAVVVAAVAKASQENGLAEIAEPLAEGLNPGTHIEQYIAQVVSRLRAIDRDGDGLDRADIDFQRLQGETQERARNIQQILSYDYDGDFRVTRAEIELGAGRDADQRSREAEAMMGLYDADGDGVVTLREAADREPGGRRDRSFDGFLALDPDGDGKLTAVELIARAEQLFKRFDSDGDGTLSKDEYAQIADRLQQIRTARNAPICNLAALPPDAQLLVFGTYDGQAISSAVIGGQDSETNLIDVTIEPGSRPLYLILTSYESMIWRLRGATGRVRQVVASSLKAAPGGTSASGVTGVSPDKVQIAPAGCPNYFSQLGEPDAQRSLASIRSSLQREPDAVFATYSPQGISLPSGQIASARETDAALPKGFDAATWADAVRYWPAGLVRVDPRQVVSKSKVEKYLVLPSQMGISQLVGSGAVKREKSDVFRVLRPIAHMPPSMGGAHSMTLIFSKGVPVATGDKGHSCIVNENSGESRGTRCRSSQ
ncbi:EF-hand domain-containing protein [Sphingopyxis macrogoltabida]|uniref:EF-hand domain-containing protein n=1 Tax=Sphingopyxis macrogoltabida TaxID=33050 RepID=UPI000A02F7EC|nr:EF-hand domain-containing protein [Sphingopyxis macrogoltabida]